MSADRIEDAAVVALAKRMARAAGPQTADTMGRACYMLLCTAALIKDPDRYMQWLDGKTAEHAQDTPPAARDTGHKP